MAPRFRLDAEEAPKTPEPAPFMAIPQALFKSRTVLIFGEVDMKMAERVTANLLALTAEDPNKDIKIVIHSPGGHVESGDTIHDVIKSLRPQVKMIGTGWVASAGVHIYLGADKANRFCMPNTRFMIHQPLGGMRGTASDIEIEAEEILKMHGRINKTIADETGQPLSKVENDTDRNFWMGAEEAKAYGLVSRVIERIDRL
ncbi:MAG: ATP-dependent Clp protease proteolytic subunit [Alphaproteobacteria bacterium]|jgi:ATP-dependent Clp protease protease subunit|nr:ATP-dependent Clp protease proteolytic subunit [Alphaproteobacteria bacterium]